MSILSGGFHNTRMEVSDGVYETRTLPGDEIIALRKRVAELEAELKEVEYIFSDKCEESKAVAIAVKMGRYGCRNELLRLVEMINDGTLPAGHILTDDSIGPIHETILGTRRIVASILRAAAGLLIPQEETP